MRLKVCGIYAIRNTITGKHYVGSSSSIRDRWYQHRCDLRFNRHHSRMLQRAWNKYGENAFELLTIEVCERGELFERETFHLDRLESANPAKGYNTLPKPGSGLGYKHTDEARLRMSASHRKIPREKRLEFCRSFVGRKHTPETLAKMAETARLRWGKPGERERQAERFRGKPRSDEDRRKMREGIARRQASQGKP